MMIFLTSLYLILASSSAKANLAKWVVWYKSYLLSLIIGDTNSISLLSSKAGSGSSTTDTGSISVSSNLSSLFSTSLDSLLGWISCLSSISFETISSSTSCWFSTSKTNWLSKYK